MPASQSSPYGNGYDAEKGNDGNADTNMMNGYCFHTETSQSPWWEVSFDEVRCISQVDLTNRGDCCGM